MSQQYSLSPSGGRRITCNVKTDEKHCNYCVYQLSWLSVKRKSLWLWSNSWASLNAHVGSYLRQHETVCQMTKFHRSRGHEWGGRSLSGGRNRSHSWVWVWRPVAYQFRFSLSKLVGLWSYLSRCSDDELWVTMELFPTVTFLLKVDV